MEENKNEQDGSEQEPPKIDMDALAKHWDQNPLKNDSLSALVAMHEGGDVLLSALAEVSPEFVVDLDETDLPTLMVALHDARPYWFPNHADWLDSPYGTMKEALREHDVQLDTITLKEALAWMEQEGRQTATAGEILGGVSRMRQQGRD